MSKSLPSDWSTRRRKTLERDNYTCQNCGYVGGEVGDFEIHHIVPRRAGGTHKLSNLKTLCTVCHDSVHNKKKLARSAKPRWSKPVRSKRRNPKPERIDPKKKREVKHRDAYKCTKCGSVAPNDLRVVRIVAPEDGGTNKVSNLLTRCKDCDDTNTDWRSPNRVRRSGRSSSRKRRGPEVPASEKDIRPDSIKRRDGDLEGESKSPPKPPHKRDTSGDALFFTGLLGFGMLVAVILFIVMNPVRSLAIAVGLVSILFVWLVFGQ